MRDDFETWVLKWLGPIAFGLLALAVRVLFSADKPTVWGLARQVAVGALFGGVAGLYLSEATWLAEWQRGALIGVSVLLAEDVVLFLLRVSRKLRDEPMLFVNWLLTTFTRFGPIPTKSDDKKEGQ